MPRLRLTDADRDRDVGTCLREGVTARAGRRRALPTDSATASRDRFRPGRGCCRHGGSNDDGAHSHTPSDLRAPRRGKVDVRGAPEGRTRRRAPVARQRPALALAHVLPLDDLHRHHRGRSALEGLAHILADHIEGVEPFALDVREHDLEAHPRQIGRQWPAHRLAPLVRRYQMHPRRCRATQVLSVGRLPIVEHQPQHLQGELRVVLRCAVRLLPDQPPLEVLVLLALQLVELLVPIPFTLGGGQALFELADAGAQLGVLLPQHRVLAAQCRVVGDELAVLRDELGHLRLQCREHLAVDGDRGCSPLPTVTGTTDTATTHAHVYGSIRPCAATTSCSSSRSSASPVSRSTV